MELGELDTTYLDELKTKVREKLDQTELYRYKGTVSKLLGLTVEQFLSWRSG